MDRYLPSKIPRYENLHYQKLLLAKAFRVVPGREYNKVSSALRDERQGGRSLFYEVVLDEGRPWKYLRKMIFPAFIRYLKYKRLDPRSGQGLIVSLFFQNKFYLLEAPEFINAFCELEGIDTVTFRRQVAQWLWDASV